MSITQELPMNMDEVITKLDSIIGLETANGVKLDTIISLLGTGEASSYRFINSATSTQCKTGTGVLYAVIVGQAVNGTAVSVYDNTSGTTNQIAHIVADATLANAPGGDAYSFGAKGIAFSTGLRVVTNSANQRVTVVFK